MHRLGKVIRRNEANGDRLGLVWLWISRPVSRQEAHRKAVRHVAVGVVDRVRVSLGQAAEGHEAACRYPDARLLSELIDRSLSEAAPGLSGTCRQAPVSGISALGQQDAFVVSL